MGKVNFIQKSRKECKCHKCGKTIPIGSQYYRGSLRFQNDIIRCKECGLKSWEVTTSWYQLEVGDIVYNWQEYYEISEAPSEITEALEGIRDMCQENLDNMPESLQYSETGEMLQERIDMLDEVISEIEYIEVDEEKLNSKKQKEREEAEQEIIENIEQALEVLDI